MAAFDPTGFGISGGAGEAGNADQGDDVEEQELLIERLRNLQWPTVPPGARERGWERLRRAALARARDGSDNAPPPVSHGRPRRSPRLD